jgi:hypothetical protein
MTTIGSGNAPATGGLRYCLIAFHFPPDTSAGAVRAHGLARKLAEAGNEVHVFTAATGPLTPEGYAVHVVPGQQFGTGFKRALGVAPGGSPGPGVRRGPSRVLGKLMLFAREWLLYPDDARAWARACAAAVVAWGTTARPDVLVSTAPPWSVHVAARRAFRLSVGRVWIADWRDLWTPSPHYGFGRFRRLLDQRLERKLLHDSGGITVTTPMMADMLAKAYPGLAVVPIYNGYDERRLAQSKDRSPGHTRLVITYAGYLYQGKRSVVPFLSAVSELITQGHIDATRVCLQFAGPSDATLDAEVDRLGLGDTVLRRGVVARDKVPALLETSDVLLVIMWDAVREASLVPAKTFEYIEARRPILALRCSPSGELGRLLTQTRTGVCVESDGEIGAAVLGLYQRFVSEGAVRVDPDMTALESFAHGRMAEQFDDTARSLLEHTRADQQGAPRASVDR